MSPGMYILSGYNWLLVSCQSSYSSLGPRTICLLYSTCWNLSLNSNWVQCRTTEGISGSRCNWERRWVLQPSPFFAHSGLAKRGEVRILGKLFWDMHWDRHWGVLCKIGVILDNWAPICLLVIMYISSCGRVRSRGKVRYLIFHSYC